MSTSADGARSGTRSRAVLVGTVAAVVSVLAALAFPFAPVAREEVTYSWRGDEAGARASAFPMLPYQPVRTTAVVSCAAAAAAPGVLLSTTPPVVDPAAEPLSGLRITSDGAQPPTVTVTSGSARLDPVRLPAGAPCLLTVRSDGSATELVLTVGAGPGTVVGRVEGDVRPAVVGVFAPRPAPPGGLGLDAVGDTRFQTSISGPKVALGVVAALGAAVVVGVLARLDRRRRGPPGRGRRTRRRWGLADTGVLGALALWQLIGPISVDDGYIAGIVRARFDNGQVGTVFRWLNSPETPFGWFYDVLAAVAAVDPAPFWLRLPSTLLGAVAWLLLTRALLPRLGLAPRPSARPWWALLTGTVFLAWWLPFGLGVRPEPWVVVGTTLVMVLVERAVTRRAAAPAFGALVVAGATLAVTPTGLIAFTPFLAAVVPLARLVRARRVDAGPVLLALGTVAALATTLLLVHLDQTWASTLDSVDIRRLIGGDRPWTDEYARYASLLTAGDGEGSIGRRAPVLVLAVSLVALVFLRVRGIPREPAKRLLVVTVASLAVLALTPTKWTHHFGAFAVLGTAVTLLALHAWRTTPAGARQAPQRAAAGTTLAAVTAGLVLAGQNQWHWISGYFVAWNDRPPQIAGVRLADLALLGGVVAAAGLAGIAVRRRVRPEGGPTADDRRLLAIPPTIVVGVVVLVVAVEIGSTARTAVARRDSYTLASDSIASLTGRSCGLADQLRVEADPRPGLLGPDPSPRPGGPGTPPLPAGQPVATQSPGAQPPGAQSPGAQSPGAQSPGAQPLTAAGVALPGWRGPDVTGGWFAVPAQAPPAPDDGLPLVLTVTGPVILPGRLALEVADPATGTITRIPVDEAATQYSDSASVAAPAARDLRVDRAELPPGGAVRVVTTADAPADQGVSVPRFPRTEPWSQVLAPGTPAAIDWPAAFLFPCTPIAALRDGTAALPGWRVSLDARAEQRSGYISYTASQGGPWATARVLVRQERLPVYLPGLPLTDVAGLERWVPVMPLGPGPRVERERRTEWGTTTPGPLTVGRG